MASESASAGVDSVETVSEPLPNTTRTEEIFIKIEPDDIYDESAPTAAADPTLDLPGPSEEPPAVPALTVTVKQEKLQGDQELPLSVSITEGDGDVQTEEVYGNEALARMFDAATGKFVCVDCSHPFTTKSNLKRHLLIHAQKTNRIECKDCKRTFLNRDQLDKHTRLNHISVKIYHCSHCELTFRAQLHLQQHEKIHEAEKPYQCNVCERQFSTPSNLVKHVAKSRCKDPDCEPLICTVCCKRFDKPFLLKSHMRKHETARPHECDVCKLKFKYKSTLTRHMQLHNGVRAYSCEICNKTFSHPGLVTPHMRSHSGEKPYECAICQKFFSHKHNMQRHMLRHNKVKQLVCEICHKQFPRESRLKYHMRIHMVDNRPFKCQFCPKCFSHKQNVLRHYSRKHPNKEYQMPESDASVASKIWQKVMEEKLGAKTDYIVPEIDDGKEVITGE